MTVAQDAKRAREAMELVRGGGGGAAAAAAASPLDAGAEATALERALAGLLLLVGTSARDSEAWASKWCARLTSLGAEPTPLAAPVKHPYHDFLLKRSTYAQPWRCAAPACRHRFAGGSRDRWRSMRAMEGDENNVSLCRACVARFLGVGVGDRVRRNAEHWDWGDQDGGAGTLGVVTAVHGLYNHDPLLGWVSVLWDGGAAEHNYRFGSSGFFDVELVRMAVDDGAALIPDLKRARTLYRLFSPSGGLVPEASGERRLGAHNAEGEGPLEPARVSRYLGAAPSAETFAELATLVGKVVLTNYEDPSGAPPVVRLSFAGAGVLGTTRTLWVPAAVLVPAALPVSASAGGEPAAGGEAAAAAAAAAAAGAAGPAPVGGAPVVVVMMPPAEEARPEEAAGGAGAAHA
jgi:hypothetical protein